jgi:hypothetical protein
MPTLGLETNKCFYTNTHIFSTTWATSKHEHCLEV